MSVEGPHGRRLVRAGEDVPTFFYHLGISEMLSQFFVFGGVAPSEVRSSLLAEGWTGPLADATTRFLAFCVAPMAWSSAVWAAQRTFCSVVMPLRKPIVDPDPESAGPNPLGDSWLGLLFNLCSEDL